MCLRVQKMRLARSHASRAFPYASRACPIGLSIQSSRPSFSPPTPAPRAQSGATHRPRWPLWLRPAAAHQIRHSLSDCPSVRSRPGSRRQITELQATARSLPRALLLRHLARAGPVVHRQRDRFRELSSSVIWREPVGRGLRKRAMRSLSRSQPPASSTFLQIIAASSCLPHPAASHLTVER